MISPAAFFIFSRGNKNAKVLERRLLSVFFSGSVEKEKIQNPVKWASSLFFFSFPLVLPTSFCTCDF